MAKNLKHKNELSLHIAAMYDMDSWEMHKSSI